MRKCKSCGKREAIYLVQYVASDKPSIYTPGYHIRGFSTLPVCQECADRIRAAAEGTDEKVTAPF
jgi:hypothetical protein